MLNGKNLKILVVDDSDVIQNSIKEYFAEYDLEIITCADGLEGIKNVIELRPNIILLDLMMPNLDGLKMLQVIKIIEDVKYIPVIVISGNTSRTNVMSSLEAGADKVLSKPLRKQDLIANVQEVLGLHLVSNTSGSKRNIELEDREIKQKIVELFYKSYEFKKEKIKEYVRNKDTKNLYPLVHELKGTGGMVGFPMVSIISNEIERILETDKKDWVEIKIKSEKIFSILEKKQNESLIVK